MGKYVNVFVSKRQLQSSVMSCCCNNNIFLFQRSKTPLLFTFLAQSKPSDRRPPNKNKTDAYVVFYLWLIRKVTILWSNRFYDDFEDDAVFISYFHPTRVSCLCGDLPSYLFMPMHLWWASSCYHYSKLLSGSLIADYRISRNPVREASLENGNSWSTFDSDSKAGKNEDDNLAKFNVIVIV